MIIENLIYILQSENYAFIRFLNFTYTHLFWWKLQRRQKINWTQKARFLQIVSYLVTILFVFGIFIIFPLFLPIISIIILYFLLPFVIGFSLLIAKLPDSLLKKRKINRAKKILLENKLVVVGITGSYGKTSTKEILANILKKKYRIVKTLENINTDIGIANFIINNKARFQEAEIFIVEMGAHHRGEIRKICDMVFPEYSILTGINESHLERFGSLKKIIQTKFELPMNTKNFSVLNFDDENIGNNYEKFHLKNAIGVSQNLATEIKAKEKFSGIEFRYENSYFETKLLAQHNVTLILMCCQIALKLGISINEISEAVSRISPVAHRLEPLYNKTTNVTVIDDSYNGNFDGIKSGIQVLSRAKGRKLVLTPGLVELGEASKKVHIAIGELYAKKVDEVLLIKSPMTNFIVEGLKKNNFQEYHLYESTEKAHADMANVIKNGDTIIFQNDLTDNYF